jgi:hypothetical protein
MTALAMTARMSPLCASSRTFERHGLVCHMRDVHAMRWR